MTPSRRLPSLSVVVPSLDQGAFLGGALDSIIKQQYPNVEIIVMDGGSSDGSVEIIASRQADLDYWQSRSDGGQSAAINAGVERSRGELVAWLNADDEYVGDALWLVARAYAQQPEAGLYVGNGFRDRGEGGRTAFCRRHLALDRTALVEGLDYLLQPAVFVARRAWDEVGGLDSRLRYCMDWDLFIRVAKCFPAVLINEFIAASREYPGTKTATGGLARAMEIAAVAARHSGEPTTPGALYYQLETILALTEGSFGESLRDHVWEGMKDIRRVFARRWGNADGFPETGDDGDEVFLPVVDAADRSAHRHRPVPGSLPRVSIVTPSFNQAQFLERCLRSVLDQGYPHLETIVVDGGSTDGSVDVLRDFAGELGTWISEPDRGAAHAINKGLSRARGEILGWLNSDDMLADEAIWLAVQAFSEDPDLDMVFGNALYVDAEDRPVLADHGSYRTALYFGENQAPETIPLYWTYVHAVPQPTVFFRRELLSRCGPLDESLRFIFDFDLFDRFTRVAKVAKIERTMAFYRLHADSKTGGDWGRFKIELYAHSRARWASRFSAAFYRTLLSFVRHYVQDRFGAGPHGPAAWSAAALVGLSAFAGLGNPERWRWTSWRRAPSPPVSADEL